VRTPFDAQRPIARQDLRQILEAGRWAPYAIKLIDLGGGQAHFITSIY
jgi:nitroreductase